MKFKKIIIINKDKQEYFVCVNHTGVIARNSMRNESSLSFISYHTRKTKRIKFVDYCKSYVRVGGWLWFFFCSSFTWILKPEAVKKITLQEWGTKTTKKQKLKSINHSVLIIEAFGLFFVFFFSCNKIKIKNQIIKKFQLNLHIFMLCFFLLKHDF